MTRRGARDAGQAFPVYIAAVAGLFFLAFVYFAVGQASMKKNEAQTAADAAALAAARDVRDGLLPPKTSDIGEWQEFLDGLAGGGASNPCAQADVYASKNGARAIACDGGGPPEISYTVTVETNTAIGESVIESTRTTKAKATARAVLEPLCRVVESDRPTPTPSPTNTGNEDGGRDDEGEDISPVEIDCAGEKLTIDPEHLDALPDSADLFAVHLADR